MLVENEQDWIKYRGMSPAFVKRVREKQKAAQPETVKMEKRKAYLERIEMLKREAETSRAAALKRKAEREVREAAERIAMQQRAKQTAVTEFQWILATAMVIFDVTRNDIIGDSRSHRVIPARQFVMYWARRKARLSYPQIGRLLGGKDHSSVLHGCRAYVAKRAAMGRFLRAAR